MKKLCVFDLDGTLLDTIDDLREAANFALKNHNLKQYSSDEYKKMVGHGIANLIEEASGISKNDKSFVSLMNDFQSYYSKHNFDLTIPYHGITDVLDKLSQSSVQIAILSNKQDVFVKKIVNHFFPNINFAIVRGQIKEFPVKPDPASLLDILKTLKYQKSEAVYIGDSDIDVQTAKNAGVECIGAVWGFRGLKELKNAKADFLALKPIDILQYL